MWQSPNGGKPFDLGPSTRSYLSAWKKPAKPICSVLKPKLYNNNKIYIKIGYNAGKYSILQLTLNTFTQHQIEGLSSPKIQRTKVSRMSAPSDIHRNLILVVLVNKEITQRWLNMLGKWKFRPGETAQSRCQLNRCTISWWSRVTMASRSLSGFHVAISTFSFTNKCINIQTSHFHFWWSKTLCQIIGKLTLSNISILLTSHYITPQPSYTNWEKVHQHFR